MNYANSLSIYGFMNKNCSLIDNSLSFWKTKSHTQLVKCGGGLLDSIPESVQKMSYMYLDEDPQIKGTYKIEQITSKIDTSFWTENLNRHNHREIFETYRKYKTKIEVYSDVEYIKEHLNDIIAMIEEWRYADYGGMKYMWQERAGVDKAFFQRYVNDEFLQDQLSVYVFVHKELDNKIIGYSVMPNIYCHNKKYDIPEVSYMLRKCLLKNDKVNLRNITEYIDWWTFEATMVKFRLVEIAINWGCSDKGVKWYKEHKWPVLYKEDKWFLNINMKRDGTKR